MQKTHIEILNIDDHKAFLFAKSKIPEINTKIPNFTKNLVKAKQKTLSRKYQRKNMPVIKHENINEFLRLLTRHEIQINNPFRRKTYQEFFKTGLQGKEYSTWIVNGIDIFKGSEKVDNVKAHIEYKRADELEPVQHQIFLDKAVDMIKKNGFFETLTLLTKKQSIIVSSDNYIIDGHHRWLTAMLINPRLKIKCVVIEMKLFDLLPIATAYTNNQ